MLIQTNLPYLRKPSVPVEMVEQWLDKHPNKRAENLTGKVSDKPINLTPHNGSYKTKELVQ